MDGECHLVSHVCCGLMVLDKDNGSKLLTELLKDNGSAQKVFIVQPATPASNATVQYEVRCIHSLSCIKEYLATDSGGNVS